MRAKRRSILLLTPGCQGADGVSAFSRLCIEALAEQHAWLDVSVWSLADVDDSERPLPSKITQRFAGGSKTRMMRWGLELAWAPPSHVLCTHMNMAPIALPGVMRGSKLNIALLGIEAWRPLRRRDHFCVRQATNLIAISQHTVNRFHETNPQLMKVPVQVCHLCLPLQVPIPPQNEDDPPFALIVGRMSSEERYKGHDELLDVWPEVAKRVPNAGLTVVGSGDDLERLRAKAQKLGLSSHVRFLGRVSDATLAELYARCAFFAMPSRDEGFGLVFLEAMRAGKACLGGSGAASEIIEHGRTGFIVDHGNSSALRECLLTLFAEPGLRQAMGLAGKAREESHFSISAFRKRLLDQIF
jgi:phosphatidylinositol alpha-1,6-mannosyltransferase